MLGLQSDMQGVHMEGCNTLQGHVRQAPKRDSGAVGIGVIILLE